ncbi:hypothetical protein [Furfurilactobacillus milii]|uniref:Uncharacterized protein n=1 Tax=Furfurilactobacillus milii TaxID=2888272 RepID=A0A6N9I649_9LACO|nr:hypothetical protein [Furfurilactobacillus milii]MYV18267.1 hypothetical protein [Furfurilactobacillus milii]
MDKDPLEHFDYTPETSTSEEKMPEDLRLSAQMTGQPKRQGNRLTTGAFVVIMSIDVVLLLLSLIMGMPTVLAIAVVIAIVDVVWGIWLIR